MQPLDFYAFARQVGGFTVLEGIRQHWRRGSYSYLDRPRPGYGIMLMIRGGIRFRTNEGELSAAAGDLLFLPKHSRYEALFENGTEDYLVNFELSEVSVATSEPTLLLQNASLEVFRRFDEMTDEARRSGASSLRCKAQLLVLLEEIVKNINVKSMDEQTVIARAKELLEEKNDRSIKEIASICSISESGLRQKFKELEGITPIAYRRRRRIGQAKYLLEASELSIAEIAEVLGFYDAPYFCRIFKKELGVTPKEYLSSRRI